MLRKKYEKYFFCSLTGEIFFDTHSDWNKQFFSTLILGVKVENLEFEERCHFVNVLDFQILSQQILSVLAVCVTNKSSNSFKRYLGEDIVYKFISDMVAESKYLN